MGELRGAVAGVLEVGSPAGAEGVRAARQGVQDGEDREERPRDEVEPEAVDEDRQADGSAEDDLPDEERLDAALEAQGYRIAEPVFMRAGPAEALAAEAPEHLTTFPLWPPLAVTATVWAEGGVGPERLAIMDIAPGPKTVVLGRTDDRAAGAVFVAINGDTAMVHALHVAKTMRRKGLARNLMRGVGRWALENGARNVALAVTRANVAANGLYEALGMTVVGSYHYRIK